MRTNVLVLVLVRLKQQNKVHVYFCCTQDALWGSDVRCSSSMYLQMFPVSCFEAANVAFLQMFVNSLLNTMLVVHVR